MSGLRRLVATLACGCRVQYPRGVPARSGELVWCARHGETRTASVAAAPSDATIERRERRTRASDQQK